MMSINKIILVSLFVKLFAEPPIIYDELSCGKSSPKKPKDCTKYGTGSGMVCCWISDVAKNNGICRLVPDDTAREQGISGENTFSEEEAEANKRYWDCGNKSNYIYFDMVIILMFLFLL